MIKRYQPPLFPENHWHTVAQFSLPDGADYENQATETVAKALLHFCIPDQILAEVQRAINNAIEKELSEALPIRAQRTYIILIRTQQKQSLGTVEFGNESEMLHSRSRGWGFFLTERRTSGTEVGYPTNRVVISVHLYQEGQPGETTDRED